MNETLFKKYNVPVPRYTSYPTANEFEPFDAHRYLKAVETSNDAAADNISFYIHVPFCRHLCHYCGCNSVAMAQPKCIEEYFETLHQEIDLLLPHLRKDRRISQIHYGGGSPSSMPLALIRGINEHLLSAFSTIDKPEIAIECHPGYLESNDWQYLLDSGFNRFSLGIQDFNTDVLRTVNRRQSLLPVADIMEILRKGGAKVNFDFIYGLPKQTTTEFVSTIQTAISLHPDRLVTFSYAHLPSLFKRQMILEKAGLPLQTEKLKMFEEASKMLQSAGYVPIGMDHFVLPDDDLNVALQRHTLHRNFQGYCPRRITAQVYAFGVSGISQLDAAYAQNTKDISAYMAQVNAGQMPIQRGYALAPWQRMTREVIECIMCNNAINWHDMAQRLHVSVDEIKQAIHYNEAELQTLQADGLITFDADSVEITPDGLPFVRNVAAAFDPMMRHNHRLFSKPV
ncbi:MAG: oxygen-independent coproporphyrinogen III oxidase [Prevotella sp.]|nr:oxygen-independent coproporphyrinogen III oxidase [Prevotella sp.]MBF1584539.1 oxygen-independent coproporphyrinogen III oxidase [Prevotella sp.]